MKQTIQLSVLLLTTTITLTFFSCKKDKDDSDPIKAKTELIMTGSWTLAAYTINPALTVNGETNLYTNWPACRKDDFHTFKTNGVVEVNHGPTKCSAADAQVVNWAWSFSNPTATTMMYDGNEYTIEELSATTLRIRHAYFNVSTAKFHVKELIYKH